MVAQVRLLAEGQAATSSSVRTSAGRIPAASMRCAPAARSRTGSPASRAGGAAAARRVLARHGLHLGCRKPCVRVVPERVVPSMVGPQAAVRGTPRTGMRGSTMPPWWNPARVIRRTKAAAGERGQRAGGGEQHGAGAGRQPPGCAASTMGTAQPLEPPASAGSIARRQRRRLCLQPPRQTRHSQRARSAGPPARRPVPAMAASTRPPARTARGPRSTGPSGQQRKRQRLARRDRHRPRGCGPGVEEGRATSRGAIAQRTAAARRRRAEQQDGGQRLARHPRALQVQQHVGCAQRPSQLATRRTGPTSASPAPAGRRFRRSATQSRVTITSPHRRRRTRSWPRRASPSAAGCVGGGGFSWPLAIPQVVEARPVPSSSFRRKCSLRASAAHVAVRVLEVAEGQRLGDAGVDAGRRRFRVAPRQQALSRPWSMRSTQKVHLVATERCDARRGAPRSPSASAVGEHAHGRLGARLVGAGHGAVGAADAGRSRW